MNATLTPQTIEPRYGWITALALSRGGAERARLPRPVGCRHRRPARQLRVQPLTLPIEKAWFFDSLQGVLSADGRAVIWCAEVGAMGSQQEGPELPPLWYGTLPLD